MRSHWLWPGSELRSWQFAQCSFLQWSRIDLDLNTVGVKDQIHAAWWSCSPKMCSTTAFEYACAFVCKCQDHRFHANITSLALVTWEAHPSNLEDNGAIRGSFAKNTAGCGTNFNALLAATWEPNHIINHLETDNKSNTEWDAVRTACQGLYQDILKNTGLTSQRSLLLLG